MRQFDKHKIYKHKNMNDLAFLVTNVNDDFDNEVHLRGYWMRITSMNTLSQEYADTITVRMNDADNWFLFTTEENA